MEEFFNGFPIRCLKIGFLTFLMAADTIDSRLLFMRLIASEDMFTIGKDTSSSHMIRIIGDCDSRGQRRYPHEPA
jgi:hypothetical protein